MAEETTRGEDSEEDLEDSESIRETLLVQMIPREANALRELGRMLDHYMMNPRSRHESARLPYLEFLGVARELRYLERHLLDVAGMLAEFSEPLDELSRRWQSFAKRRAGALGKMAGEFDREIAEPKRG